MALADGVDPDTGEMLDSESVLNRPHIVRALYRISQKIRNKRFTMSPPHRKAGSPWTEDEERSVVKEFESGKHVSEIAQKFERSEGAIRSRLVRLGHLKAENA